MKARHLAAALTAISVALAACSDDTTEPTAHSVSGTGSVEDEGIAFSVTVNASTNASGVASGTMTASIDLTSLSLPVVNITATVTCLLVDGNQAWFMANVTQTSHSDIIPVGAAQAGYVKDIGGAGSDIMHAEPAEDVSSGTLHCSDRFALAQTVVKSGNYTVR